MDLNAVKSVEDLFDHNILLYNKESIDVIIALMKCFTEEAHIGLEVIREVSQGRNVVPTALLLNQNNGNQQ